MARILSGTAVAETLRQEYRKEAEELRQRGIQPGLACIRVGEKASDLAYEKGLKKCAEAAGVQVEVHALERENAARQMGAVLESLCRREDVHGILLLRPLPEEMKNMEELAAEKIPPEKDVDGMTHLSLAGVFEGKKTGFAPCTAQACLEILDAYGMDLTGKQVAVIGRSLVIGRPAAMLMMQRNATVTLCHSRTKDLADITRQADVLVCAAGKPGLIRPEYVREGQTILDVSMNYDPGKLNKQGKRGAFVGDCAFDEISEIVGAITPVPGGVGAVTSTVLMGHVIAAAGGHS